jgi:very-short-patch-repair endonuclease
MFAKDMRSAPTDAEARLWMDLRAGRLQGLKWKRQVPMGPYILDFVCFAEKLIVEVDGGQHNESVSDQQRDAWLRAQGFAVCRYWNNKVLGNLDGVLADILHHATPSLPPLFHLAAGTPLGFVRHTDVRRDIGVSTLIHEGREASLESRQTSPAAISPSPLVGEGLGRGGGSPMLSPNRRKTKE